MNEFSREDPRAESTVAILRVSLSSSSVAYVVCMHTFSTCHLYLRVMMFGLLFQANRMLAGGYCEIQQAGRFATDCLKVS